MGTTIQLMLSNMVRLVSHPQRMSLVSFLPTWLPSRLPPQSAGTGLLQPIAAGRLIAIVTILGQLVETGV